MRPDAYRNNKKYCYFHRKHDHDTDDCHQLKWEIETLIHRGYLGKYVNRPKPSKKGKELMEHPVDNQPIECEVNLLDRLSIGREVSMIFGGTRQPPKKLKTGEEISKVSFSGEDLVGVHNPNNESIVISMTIAKHPIKRILVDMESSADVLLYDAFVRMNLPMQTLRPSPAPLVAFNDESIEVEGEVILPVTIGTPP